MPRKQSRGRRRRTRKQPLITEVDNSSYVANQAELTFKTDQLEILPDRNYRPLTATFQLMASTQPSLIQISLYGVDGVPVFSSRTVMVGSHSRVFVRLRWPSPNNWFPSNKLVTLLSIRCPCLAAAQHGGGVSFLCRIRVQYGADIDERKCPTNSWEPRVLAT